MIVVINITIITIIIAIMGDPVIIRDIMDNYDGIT